MAQNRAKGSAAELAVSDSGTVGTDFIAAVVAESETRYPDIVIILREQPLTDPLVGLGDPQVDVAITSSPLDSSVDGLTCEVLITDGAVAVLPDAHPLARLNAISAVQLSQEHVLQWPGSPTNFSTRTAENEQLPNTTAEMLTAVASAEVLPSRRSRCRVASIGPTLSTSPSVEADDRAHNCMADDRHERRCREVP